MDSKFLGVGLTNVIGIALFTMLVSVILKVIFTKYEVEGITYEADLLANSDVKPSRVFIKILIFVIILVFAFLYLKAKQNQKKKRKVKYYKGR